MPGGGKHLQTAHLGSSVMAIPLRAQSILHISGGGKSRKPFYLDCTTYLCHLGVRFFDFVKVHVIEVSG